MEGPQENRELEEALQVVRAEAAALRRDLLALAAHVAAAATVLGRAAERTGQDLPAVAELVEALQVENDQLRAEVERLRSGSKEEVQP
jgi:prefoldin subunit 5